MKKLSRELLTALALIVTSFSVQAAEYYDEPEYYAAIGTGQAVISVNAVGSNTVTATPISLLIGAQLNDRIGLEATYSTGSALNDVTNQTLSLRQITAMGTFSKWLNEEILVIGKVGYGYGSTNLNASTIDPALQSGSASASGLTYGVAVEYRMDDYMGLRLSWTKVKSAVVTGTTTVPVTSNGDVTEMGAWLTYRF